MLHVFERAAEEGSSMDTDRFRERPPEGERGKLTKGSGFSVRSKV